MSRNKIFNNNILVSDESIMYLSNIDVVENDNKQYIKPNSLVLTSYNFNIMKNHHYKNGTSYELMYIDNDNNKHVLTYTISEGNGLYKDENDNIFVGIDNKTIKENDNHEIYVDSYELVTAYNDITKGLLCGENKIFYDHILNKSGFTTSENGIIKVSNGLMMSLYEIQNYYNEFELLSLNINKIAIKLNKNVDLFEVGDILYIDSEGKYTKNPENNMPYMICVIASNTLSDKCARFIPIKNNFIKNVFAKNSNSIYYKNLYSHIPIYADNLNKLANGASVISGNYGFIATDNSYWKNNFKNPFNFNKHYYAGEYTIIDDIIWYLNPDTSHSLNMYSIDKNAIVTELVNKRKEEIEDDLQFIIFVKFSDGFEAYYLLDMSYNTNTKRYELKSSVAPEKHVILLINKINETSTNYSNKIKIIESNNLINLNDLINKYQISSYTSTGLDSFNEDYTDDIDYKILATQNQNSISSNNSFNNTMTLLRRYSNTDNTISKYYTYKLIIDPYICDIDKAYLKVQLGDSANNISDIIYITYENNKGISHEFTDYYSTINTGYIKITIYASEKYYDMNPIELGIFKVNEYDGLLKCVHLTKEKNTLKFKLKNIIPIEAKIYRNNTPAFKEYGIILESNYYDNLENTIEYSINLNYSSCINETLYENYENNVNDTTAEDIGKDIIVNFNIINLSSEVVTLRGDLQLMLSNPDDNGIYHGWFGVYNRTDHIYLSDENITIYPGTSKQFDNILLEGMSGRHLVDDENMTKTHYPRNVLLYDLKGTYNTILCKNVNPNLYLNNGKTYTIIIPGENKIVSGTKTQYFILENGITLYIKDSQANIFDSRKYYVYLNIRNVNGDSTTGKYEFIKYNNTLVLNEKISVYDIEGINQISVYKIETIDNIIVNAKIYETGKVINRIVNWLNIVN